MPAGYIHVSEGESGRSYGCMVTPTLTRAVLVLSLLAAALIPAPAEAGWKIDRSLAIAGVVWNHPCQDRIELRWARLPDEIGGQVTMGECALTMNDRYSWTWQAFCRTVIHEVGHIAGVQHSTNPRSVMWPEVWTSMDSALINGQWVDQRDRRCRDRGRPYLSGVL